MSNNYFKVSTVAETTDAFGRFKNTNEESGNLFLHELSPPFERLVFQFVPQELNWQRSGNWVNVQVPGRNNSYHQLTGGEDRLTLSVDYNGWFEKDPDMCVKKFSWLQSLTVIDGQNGSRRVKLIWGNTSLMRFKIWIVRSVTGRMSMFHRGRGFNPQQLYSDIELELDPSENTNLSDVRLSGSGNPDISPAYQFT